MDGGILFGGENSYQPPGGTRTKLSGMISRHDSQGNELWRDYVYNSGCTAIYSARQLSCGGYIAAGKAWSPENGQQGFLIKYAPETGIEFEETPDVAGFEFYPNPFYSELSISFEVSNVEVVELSVFDLSGRLVKRLVGDFVSSGVHLSVWKPDDLVPAGCYLITLSDSHATTSGMCVYLK